MKQLVNKIIHLKGKEFKSSDKKSKGGGFSFNSKVEITSSLLDKLIDELKEIKQFWLNETKYFKGILLSVEYNKIVAKSNRISGLLKGSKSNDSIVGIKYTEDKKAQIITYLLDIKDVQKSIDNIEKTKEVLVNYFDNKINKPIFENIKNNNFPITNNDISFSNFKQIIADISYIHKFFILQQNPESKTSLVTIFNTNTKIKTILESIGINTTNIYIMDDNVIYLDENQIEILKQKAAYLISMAVSDIKELDDFVNQNQTEQENNFIQEEPNNEPIIGVIDTAIVNESSLGNWVEYHHMIDKNIPINPAYCTHGIAVTSVIVDGPRVNPELDDGCGRFRVRHFGIVGDKQFSAISFIRKIKEIIPNNLDIKVWNISLGSNSEISDNFISYESWVLDELQNKYDVIFVVSGTNKTNDSKKQKIGSPADSINSIVVNSVDINNESASYTREGLALTYFIKPDIAYYGGDYNKGIVSFDGIMGRMFYGTSFAAPWITRKLAFLINILGFNKETAKALLVDAARGWSQEPSIESLKTKGHGVVPIRIEEIVKTKKDEIKFIVSGITKKWNNYIYEFPIPLVDNKYPFIIKATMCYFPKCNRNQGVDYTNVELNLRFGRINDEGEIKDVKNNKQGLEREYAESDEYLYEEEARKQFEKWRNVKIVIEDTSKNHQPKKSYTKTKNWGMEIKTTNRINKNDSVGVKFGVVVTLKEIKGVNRIDDFIKNCILNNWIVDEISIDNKIDINNKMQEKINLF